MSIGSNKGSNRSISTSIDEALASSFSNSLGTSTSTTQSGSFVDPIQQAARASLFGQALGATNVGGATTAAQGAATAASPFLRQAMGSTAALMDPRTQIAAQEESLASGLGQLFREELMPGIKSGAIAAGGFGGGRQGVSEGVAAGQIGQAYTQGLGDITANANNQALTAAGQMPSLASSLFSTAMQPFTAGLGILGQLGSILGPATVLNTSSGSSVSRDQTTAGSSSKSSGKSQVNTSGSSGGFNLGWS